MVSRSRRQIGIKVRMKHMIAPFIFLVHILHHFAQERVFLLPQFWFKHCPVSLWHTHVLAELAPGTCSSFLFNLPNYDVNVLVGF